MTTKKKQFEMRDLNGGDIFTLLDIINSLDVADELISIFDTASSKKNTDATKIAVVLLKNVLKNIGKIKVPLNAFLSDLTGIEVAEIESLSLKDYFILVTAFFQKPDLRDFFSSIASLLGTETANTN